MRRDRETPVMAVVWVGVLVVAWLFGWVLALASLSGCGSPGGADADALASCERRARGLADAQRAVQYDAHWYRRERDACLREQIAPVGDRVFRDGEEAERWGACIAACASTPTTTTTTTTTTPPDYVLRYYRCPPGATCAWGRDGSVRVLRWVFHCEHKRDNYTGAFYESTDCEWVQR